jgi:phosphoribosylformimino-5-aminoimidazole carboxamide ribotide isomerase
VNLRRGGCRSAVVDLLPAIDIHSGRVVRLIQGEPARQTVYGDDPLAVAEHFVEQGARWIHLVDLDRALGAGDNFETMRRVARKMASRVKLQLGGGFRSQELLRAGLALGVARIVIGTAAVTDPAFLPAAVAAVGAKHLALGIDARDGFLAVRGWTETTSRRAEELVRQVLGEGIQTVVYTDISRDGMLAGPDISGAVALQQLGARVIVSGGVATAADVRSACEAGLSGIIVGRALYEARLDLPQALAAADCSPD